MPVGFPDYVTFHKPWRAYQSRFLSKLDEYARDGHIHFVAAPGSGKTVLGLEAIRRFNRPTLILAPTIAIRDQWIERFRDSFLPAGVSASPWISTDLRAPAFLTAATFQALHMLCSGQSESGDKETVDEEDGEPSSTLREASMHYPEILGKTGFRTLVVDEAHHLRAEWWKTLTFVAERLENPTTLALTATPPYDVSSFEWQRYVEFCGPIDAEVSVPELVLEGDLCPHQDYVYFSVPEPRKLKVLLDFRAAVDAFTEQLRENSVFGEAVAGHHWITNPNDHVEEILDDPEYLSSMVIFLNAVGRRIPPTVLDVLALSRKRIPLFDLAWLETLLSGCLYTDSESFARHQPSFKILRHELLAMGAIEHRKVKLRNPSNHLKLLTTSATKLKSIVEIVSLEAQSLGSELRCVVLTDFIRKSEIPSSPSDQTEFEDIGVVPIFETLRRSNPLNVRIGVLSGSLVIVPANAGPTLQSAASDLGIESGDLRIMSLAHAPEFLVIELRGDHYRGVVRLITSIVQRGAINVLVGTKSLLGEGWDAPCINALVLASFVGSYVLTNQMRGRAIRVDPERPGKTANIWHLVCIEPDIFGPGEDYELLVRRCSAFVGVSASADTIENGTERLGFGKSSFTQEEALANNKRTRTRALDRAGLARRWKNALATGSIIADGVKAPEKTAPRRFVFATTISALFLQALWIFLFAMETAARRIGGVLQESSNPFHDIVAMVTVAAMVSLPWALLALWRLIRHGTPERSIVEIGRVVVEGLKHAGVFFGDIGRLHVHANHDLGDGSVYCWVGGGSVKEQADFQRAMRELLGAIDNPRYLLARNRFGRLFFEDYFAVPESLGRKKDSAEQFAQLWRRRVGPVQLVFTRTPEGRRVLLRARAHSLASTFQRRSERISCWK